MMRKTRDEVFVQVENSAQRSKPVFRQQLLRRLKDLKAAFVNAYLDEAALRAGHCVDPQLGTVGRLPILACPASIMPIHVLGNSPQPVVYPVHF